MWKMWIGFLIAGLCWAVEDPPAMRTLARVHHVALAPDGRSIAVAMPDRVEIWDAELKAPFRVFPVEEEPKTMRLAWSADSQSLMLYTGEWLYSLDGRINQPPRRLW